MNERPLLPPSRARTCLLCGAVVSHETMICPDCLSGSPNYHDFDRLRDELAERIRMGNKLGNNKAAIYPPGIGLDLRQLLNGLRHYQIEIRVELGCGSHSSHAREVRDGHLRRIGERTADDSLLWAVGYLGLYRDVTDNDPRYALTDVDIRRVQRISVIDRLVIGIGKPRLIWEASAKQPPDEREAPRIQEERRAAFWLLVHILIVLMLIIGLAMPFFKALVERHAAAATAWGMVWWLVSTLAGSTVGCWTTWPDLSALWSRGRSTSAKNLH